MIKYVCLNCEAERYTASETPPICPSCGHRMTKEVFENAHESD